MRDQRGFSRSELRCIELFAEVLLPEGHTLPGAHTANLAERLRDRSATWTPKVRLRFRALVGVFEWLPLLFGRGGRFSKLNPDARTRWVEAALRSRRPAVRLCAMGLKQLVMLAWASTPEVEEALRFDYHCWRDDEPHGSKSSSTTPAPARVPQVPSDLHRQGPATATGAIPIGLPLRSATPSQGASSGVTTIEYPDIRDGFRTSVDVVVIGSGAGGAVAAATLAEAGLDVAVLEEGPNVEADRDFEGAVFDRFQRFYRDNGTAIVLGKPPIPLPLGRVVGGTTVVNAGTCFRAPQRVLERWESQFGLEDVSGSGLTQHYEAIEGVLNVRAIPWELLGPNAMAVHRGATSLGMSGGPLLRNITDCHGCGQCVFGCPTNAKQAMHISYLPRAVRAGAKVFSRAKVERIVLDDGRATGVIASISDASGAQGQIRFDAEHVVVAAGAIHTPVLLRTSGVPDPSGSTGRNLRVHPAGGVSGVMDDDARYWQGTMQSYYIDEIFDSHEVMFEATTAVPGIGAGSLPGFGAAAMDDLALFGSLATLGFYVSDTSKGRVHRLPGGDVFSTYRMNDLDARRFSVAIATATKVLFAAGARRVFTGVAGMDSITDPSEVESFLENSVSPARMRLTAFHPMGTVRAGRDPDRSAVDAWGRHHSIRNLWVTDASTFPTCVGVNPQMTIMALAKRSAEKLAGVMGGAKRWSSEVRTG